VHNQLADLEQAKVRTWNNLRFRSMSEVRLAIALDRAGVLFLPNCRGRLTTPMGRENREADFLVCREGKWGILEVDGEPFHPPSRTVQDHERDRLFKSHGIRVVEHFDASECFENAAKVVEKFLEILKRS
jgi:very-short-patch-repair endonuclease